MPHRNNFDFLRLLFASLVIVTHSVALTVGGDGDFLYRLTNGQTDGSYLGVRGFFVISGFLVFQSLQRSNGIAGYLKKRALRIFPGLLVMLLVVTFIAGPLLSDLPFTAYFSSPDLLHYSLSALHIPVVVRTDHLPGVFSHNPITAAVNGSLWTIWFEILFYLALVLFYPVRRSITILRWLLPGVWLLLYITFVTGHAHWGKSVFPLTGMSTEVALDLALYFAAGSSLALLPWNPSKRLRAIAAFFACAALIIAVPVHQFTSLRYLAWPVLVVAFGSLRVPLLANIRRAGEPSYGMYIYAFPVQQAVIQCLHSGAGITTFISLPVSLLLGYASWHFIEKIFLKKKEISLDKSGIV